MGSYGDLALASHLRDLYQKISDIHRTWCKQEGYYDTLSGVRVDKA